MGHLTYLALLVGCLVVTAPLELLLRVLPESASRRQTAVDLLRALREREPPVSVDAAPMAAR